MHVSWAAYLPSPRVACICTFGIPNSTTDTLRCPTEGNWQSAEIRTIGPHACLARKQACLLSSQILRIPVHPID